MWTRGGAVVVGLVAALGGVVAAPAAQGQDAGATLVVDQAHPAGSSVHYFVRLESADGEGVGGATVTATPIGPGGTEGDPATLTEAGEDGVYEGPVEMPEDGTWTVRFASDDPEATLEYTQEMPPEGETGSGDEATDADDSAAAAEEDDDPSPVVPLVFAGVFLAALVALGTWVLLDRRRTPTPAPATPSDAAPTAESPAVPDAPTADTPPSGVPASEVPTAEAPSVDVPGERRPD